MVDLVTAADVANRSNGTVTADDARLPAYLEDIVGQACSIAPCLLSDDLPEHKRFAARGILAEAVLRRVRRDSVVQPDVQREVKQQGPFSHTVDYGARDGLPLLTRADRDQLSELCGVGDFAGSLQLSRPQC